jgi:cytochrome c oxidase subunit 2
VLPADSQVELHVTSLDVVHSFWAYELGIKADANPGVDNIAYVRTKGPRTFHVRCAELCGLWHPYMYNNGRIVDSGQFQSWAKQAKQTYASIKPYMDKPESDGGAPFSHKYLPAPDRRAG